MIVQMLISNFIDDIMLFWFNKKYNQRSFLVAKFLICYAIMLLYLLLMNKLNLPIAGRIVFSVLYYASLFFSISEEKDIRRSVIRGVVFGLCIVIGEFGMSIILVVLSKNTDLSSLMENIGFWFVSIIIARTTGVVFLNLFNEYIENSSFNWKKTWWSFLSIFGMIGYLFFIITCFEYDKFTNSLLLDIVLISNLVLIALIFVVYYVYFKMVNKAQQQEREIYLLKEQNKQEVKYYEEIDCFQKKIQKIYHDLKNHVLIADTLQGQREKEEYLEDLQKYFSENSLKVNSGNRILDILIQKKYEDCKKKNIDFKFSVDFRKGTFINLVDIGTIFGNIIDNAIEACERLETDEKEIHLECGELQEFLYIKIVNPMIEVRKKGNRLLSLKKEAGTHGIGLLCLQDAVEKYHGSYDYNVENHRFQLTVLLPINQ